MKEKTADKFISMQSVAEVLGCTERYVGILIREGQLTAIKLGKRAIRVSEQSLKAFIAARKVNPEDYYAPEEPPASENALISKK